MWWNPTEDDKPEPDRETTTRIQVAGLSTLSVVMKCIEAFEVLEQTAEEAGLEDSSWGDELQFLTSAMHLMTSSNTVSSKV